MRNTLAAMIVCGLGLASQAKADLWDHKTNLTVRQPIQVPGAILEPGNYVLKLQNSLVHRNIVQISNGAGKVVTTVLTIPSYRQTVSETPHFTFREVPKGQPLPIHTWFYPGETKGHEFVYLDGFLNHFVNNALAQKLGTQPHLRTTDPMGVGYLKTPAAFARAEPSDAIVSGSAD